jgi:hypothetical protein
LLILHRGNCYLTPITRSTLGNPIGGIAGGLIGGAGAALGYEFGGGSNAVKGAVKDELLNFNGKKR